jgi:MoaA/NifB/PqqE/SkfB family radical SAM enzyme
MSCSFCPYHGDEIIPLFKPKKQFMEPEMFATVLDTFPRTPNLLLGHSGEPLLHPNICQLLKLVQEKRPEVRVSISTNGLILNEINLDKLLSPGVVRRISISINTLDEEQHEKWSGTDRSLDLVLSNLKRLCDWREQNKEKKLKVYATSVVLKSKYLNIENTVRFMQRYSIDYLGFQNYIPRNYIGKETITTNDEEIITYLNKLPTRVSSRFNIGLIRPIDHSKNRNYCRQPWSQITIDPEGNMSPCCNIARNERFGKFTGKDSWNSESLVKTRQAFRNGEMPFRYCAFCCANEDPKAGSYIKTGR